MTSRRHHHDHEHISICINRCFISARSFAATLFCHYVCAIASFLLLESISTCVTNQRGSPLEVTRAATMFARADYSCPDVVPASGIENYDAVGAYVYLGNECVFSGVGDPRLTAVRVWVPHMAIDAASTLDGKSVIEINGATFYDGAQIVVNGFSPLLPGYDDLTIGDAKFTFILANSFLAHRTFGDFLTAVSFFSRFPPRCNITIFNNTFDLQVRERFDDVAPSFDILERFFTFIWFELEGGFRDHSVLLIQQNEFDLNVLTDGSFGFDLSSYKALIQARHEHAQSTGVPSGRGEWSVNGDDFVRHVALLTFAVEDLALSGFSRILIAKNGIDYNAELGIEDAEAASLYTDVLFFQRPISIEGGSGIVVHQNYAFVTTSSMAFFTHQGTNLGATFMQFLGEITVTSRSSIEITQNVVQHHAVAVSQLDTSAYDERLSHPEIIAIHSILFIERFFLSDLSLLLIALNRFATSVVAQFATRTENAALVSPVVVYSAILHTLHLTVANHSLYHVHGIFGEFVYASVPAPHTLSTFYFIDFDDGLAINNHSEVLVGCVNPFNHPDPRLRAGRPLRAYYSDAYEESLASRAQASLWNGPNIGTNATRYKLALREEEQRGLNNDSSAILRNDSFLGTRYALSREKCYPNSILINAKQEEDTSTTNLLMCFFCVWNTAFVISNSSAFTVANNLAMIWSSFPEPQSYLFFTMVTITGKTIDTRNELFRGQIVVTGTLDIVPRSTISADPDFYFATSKTDNSGGVAADNSHTYQQSPSAIIVTDNEATREWPNIMGLGHSALTLISPLGIWITQNSSILVQNNYLSMLAEPPSYFFQPNASLGKRTNRSKDAVFVSSNPNSTNYDPFLIYKNRSSGVSSIIAFDNSFMGNPNMTIKIVGNVIAYFNRPTVGSTHTYPLQVLPFASYKSMTGFSSDNDDDDDVDLMIPNFHFTQISYIDEATKRGDLYDEEGAPTAFVPRKGPPVYSAISWDTKTEQGVPVQDVWHQRNVSREEGSGGIAIIFKNQTPMHRNPVASRSEDTLSSELLPWSHDWTISMCGGKMNGVTVSRSEAASSLGALVNFKGQPLNPTRGEEYVRQHGTGLNFVHCDALPMQTPSPTLDLTMSLTCRTVPPSLSPSPSLSDHLWDSKSSTASLTPAILAPNATRGPEDSPRLQELQGTTSDIIGGVIGSVGTALSGGTSVQVSIGNALLRMSTCASTAQDGSDGNGGYDDSLPVLVHPLRFSIMASEAFHQERGAVVGNLVIAASSVAFVRLAVVYAVGRFISEGEDASVIVGWPSAVVLPFVALAEGTASSATALLRGLAHSVEATLDNNTTSNFPTPPANTEAGPLAPLSASATALNVVLGVIGLCALVSVGAWWTYSVVAVVPRGELAFTRQQHASSRLAWLFSPLYAYEYRGSITGGDSLSRTDNGASHAVPPPPPREGKDCKLEDLEDDSEEPHRGLGGSFASLMGSVTASKIKRVGDATEPATPFILPLTAAEHAARAEAVMTTTERHGHMLGDRVFLWVELLCYASVVVVGVSEGLGDNTAQCRARITVAAVAALAQVALNALTTIPLDLCMQLLLGLVTAVLALMAVVRVYAEGSAGAGLVETMDVVSTVGNLLGLTALALEVFTVGLRLFRARRQRQARAMALHSNLSGLALPHGGLRRDRDATAYDDSEELSSMELSDDQGKLAKKKDGRSAAKRQSRATTANQAFQINVDFGDDLDLFLQDVEEEAMRVDELELSLDEGAEGYQPVEALGEPEIDLD